MSDVVPKLLVVTYLRQNEHLNEAFFHFASTLSQNTGLAVEFCVFAETDTFAAPEQKRLFTHVLIQPRATKFARLGQLLETTDADYLLSMDSDVEPNTDVLLSFLFQAISSHCDLAWGRISCRPSGTLAGQLVELDKWLSHCVIRPALWALHLGISVPGQIMLLRCEPFRQSIHYDTFLDDAALGLYARRHHLRTFHRAEILGHEAPSSTLPILFAQRRRWAHGYASLLRANLFSPSVFYVLIHGMAYHLLEPLLVVLWVILSCWFPIVGLAILGVFLLTALFCSKRLFFAAVLYPVIFLFLHFWWAMCMCWSLLFQRG